MRTKTFDAARAGRGAAFTLGLAAVVALAACGTATTKAATVAPQHAAPTAQAAPPKPAHATIGAFHVSNALFQLNSTGPTELFTQQLLILPGKTTGWHTHPGPGFVVIVSGTLTRYQVGANGTCAQQSYGPGQGFVELPGVVHDSVNQGSTPVTGYSTFLDIPAGNATSKTPAISPAGCPGLP